MDTKKRLSLDLPFEFDYNQYTEDELKILIFIYGRVGAEPISDDELLSAIIMDTDVGDFDSTDLFMLVQDYCVISGCGFIYQENTYNLFTRPIELIRTDGSGRTHNTDRLERLSKIVQSIPLINDVSKLHDHKGELRVTWEKEPEEDEKRIMDSLWSLFNEAQTKHITK